MEQTVTVSTLIQFGVLIMGLWGFYKVIMEIIQKINSRHDREQKWDEYEKNLQEERDKIYEKYDKKLTEVEKKIDDNHSDTGAKFQQVYAELEILTNCMAAVLDGLHQQGCNGRVTVASTELQDFLTKRAHEREGL